MDPEEAERWKASARFFGSTVTRLAPSDRVTASRCIRKDDPQEYDIICSQVVSFSRGWTNRQIASYLDLSPNTVKHHLTSLSSSSTTTFWSSGDGDYDTTLAADAGYLLPQTLTVTIGGTPVASGKVYDPSTGKFVIKEADITGDIVITASGVAETHVAAMTPDGKDFGSKTVGYDAKTTTTTSTTVATATPQTGESGDAALCISLLLVSGIGLAAAGIARRRATAR